jgi:hypothetical protein
LGLRGLSGRDAIGLNCCAVGHTRFCGLLP